ncbi:MAG: cation-transporting P-type ATPase [Firmicutes bacterium]|nr:cation-transporting P-type ATPase [Candidatus Colimorpha enterica]
MTGNWYSKQSNIILAELKTSAQSGLSDSEVRIRRARDGENNIYAKTRQPLGHYLSHLLTDYTSVIMILTLLLAAVFKEKNYIFTMLAIMLAYYAIVIFSYVRSEYILSSVAEQSLPTAKVLRNGKLYIVRQKELVRGDVILLSTGDIVPCDCRLIETDGLEILETGITGASSAVRKDAMFIDYHDNVPLTEQKNMAFAASIVTKGTGRAICCETGDETVVCRLSKNKAVERGEQAELFESVNAFCKKWTIAMTLGVFVITELDIAVSKGGEGIFGPFLLGLSAAVASMSEFYTAFAYISLACGIYSAVNRKGKVNKGAIIRSPSEIEKLKDLTCLIVPKEGAFLVNEPDLGYVWANDDLFAKGEHGYNRNAARVLRYALLSTGLYGAERLLSRNQNKNNINTPEEEIIITAAEDLGEYNASLETKYVLLQHLSKGSNSEFDTTLVAYENSYIVALRGDYNKVLPLCTTYSENSRIYEMTQDKLTELYSLAERMSRESYRVMAVCSNTTIYNNLTRLGAIQSDLTLEGLILIKENILPEAARNIARCKSAGIKVMMLCDEDNEMNYGVATSLGIAKNRKQVITGQRFAAEKEGILRAGASGFTVFAGLTLSQKRTLVKYLQDDGEKVGFLCSELDDIILLRDADIGFTRRVTISDRASGAIELSKEPINARSSLQTREAGCEALKFVADVVISSPDVDGTGGFNAVTDALLGARAVYHNMSRMVRYMITSQTAKLLLVLFSIFTPYAVTTPPQVLFCGLVIDFFALIVIALEKPSKKMLEDKIEIEKLKNPLVGNPFSILVGFLWAALTAGVLVLMKEYQVVASADLSSCFFIIFIVSQLLVVGEYKHEKGILGGTLRLNGAHALLILTCAVMIFLMLYFPAFGVLFGVKKIPYAAIAGIVMVPFLIFAFCELFRGIENRRARNSGNE